MDRFNGETSIRNALAGLNELELFALKLNLGTSSVSKSIRLTSRAARAAVHLQAPSTWTGTAKLRLSLADDEALNEDHESLASWVDFETAIAFTVAGGLLIRGIPIIGAGNIRLEVTSVDEALGTVDAVVLVY